MKRYRSEHEGEEGRAKRLAKEEEEEEAVVVDMMQEQYQQQQQYHQQQHQQYQLHEQQQQQEQQQQRAAVGKQPMSILMSINATHQEQWDALPRRQRRPRQNGSSMDLDE